MIRHSCLGEVRIPDRSFLECWSLDFDDAGFVEGFNLDSRIWVAFQLRFFRTHGRFPSRVDDLCQEGLQYLGQQLDVTVPDVGQFRFGHVNARRHRVAILRHLDVRRATDRDRSALRTWILESCRGSCPTVEDQVASGYAWCLANSVHVPSDKIMERLVRGARHAFLEGFLASVVRCLGSTKILGVNEQASRIPASTSALVSPSRVVEETHVDTPEASELSSPKDPEESSILKSGARLDPQDFGASRVTSPASAHTREHIRRFGWYFLEMEQLPEPLKPRSLQLAA